MWSFGHKMASRGAHAIPAPSSPNTAARAFAPVLDRPGATAGPYRACSQWVAGASRVAICVLCLWGPKGPPQSPQANFIRYEPAFVAVGRGRISYRQAESDRRSSG